MDRQPRPSKSASTVHPGRGQRSVFFFSRDSRGPSSRFRGELGFLQVRRVFWTAVLTCANLYSARSSSGRVAECLGWMRTGTAFPRAGDTSHVVGYSDRSRSQTLRTKTTNGRARETAARAPRHRYLSADTPRRRRVHGLDRVPCHLARARGPWRCAWVQAAAAADRVVEAGASRARGRAAERR